MTGWQVLGWVLIGNVSIVLTGCSVGFAAATIKAFVADEHADGIHIFRGRNDQ